LAEVNLVMETVGWEEAQAIEGVSSEEEMAMEGETWQEA